MNYTQCKNQSQKVGEKEQSTVQENENSFLYKYLENPSNDWNWYPAKNEPVMKSDEK